MRATYVILDGLSLTFAGDTSGATGDAAARAASGDVLAVAGALPSADGAAAVSGFAACEHAPSAPADMNAIAITE
jgi:hypothetical protein